MRPWIAWRSKSPSSRLSEMYWLTALATAHWNRPSDTDNGWLSDARHWFGTRLVAFSLRKKPGRPDFEGCWCNVGTQDATQAMVGGAKLAPMMPLYGLVVWAMGDYEGLRQFLSSASSAEMSQTVLMFIGAGFALGCAVQALVDASTPSLSSKELGNQTSSVPKLRSGTGLSDQMVKSGRAGSHN
ncbi:hypothetical protein L1887_47360 [Cichorium endivia]|nr:hypothetical protein L1887_47360 [Cichorium endivia]